MYENKAEEAEAEEVLWPDGSPVTVGQSVRIVIAEPRYTGKIGEVASVNYCHPRKDNAAVPECQHPQLHHEVGVAGVVPGLVWFRMAELQRCEGGSHVVSSPVSPANGAPVGKGPKA